MRIFQLTLLGVMAIISLGAVAISAYMNWIWGNTLSAIPLYKNITGAIALVFDLVKAFLPLIGVVAVSAGIAFSHKSKNAFMFLLSLGSIWAAFLFLTSNRLDSFAVLKNQVSNRVEVVADIALKTREIKAIKKHRPFVVVDAAYSARCYTERRKRWTSCKALLKERGRALAAMDLKKELKDLKTNKKTMKVVGSASGGLGNVSDVTGITVERISNIQALVTAFMLEVLTGYIPAIVFAALFSLLQIMKREKEERRLEERQQAEKVPALEPETGRDTVGQMGADLGTEPEQVFSPVGGAIREGSLVEDVLKPIYVQERAALEQAALRNDAGSYFAARCKFVGGGALNSIALHGDYQAWCRVNSLQPQNYFDFVRDLHGIVVQKLGLEAVEGDVNSSALGSFLTFRGIDIVAEKATIQAHSRNPNIVPITA